MTAVSAAAKSMDDIVALCKRRGFIFPASEIYGGINGFWDYGPLGTALKNNLRDRWWRDMVECPPDGPDGHPLSIVGLDSAIIQNPKVWEASGHVEGFNDPMVDCRECKARLREDHIKRVSCFKLSHLPPIELPSLEALKGYLVEPKVETYFTSEPEGGDGIAIGGKSFEKRLGRPVTLHQRWIDNQEREQYWVAESKNGFWFLQIVSSGQATPIDCPRCGASDSLTAPRQFNLMFPTYVGAVFDEENKAYLRPETAQGIFINFKNILDTMRVKVPFGIAQIGKAFRNEVTPRNFIFRSREFEQMEMEWFCPPDQAKEWYDYWVEARMNWWKSLGISADNLVRREHDDDELAHYSTACADVEYRYPFTAPGFGELEGIAHRGDYDLNAHQEKSKAKLQYFDQERNERYLPHVIEPAAGLSRGVLVLLCEAYTPDENRPSKVYMRFDPTLAPIQAAVFPLVAKDGMPEIAEALYKELRTRFRVQFDIKQTIGKRYARMDEVGTPFCFTIDGQTKEDQTVTVRDRDTTEQQRIAIDSVERFLQEKIGA